MMNEIIRKQHIHQRKRFTPLPLAVSRFRIEPVNSGIRSRSVSIKPVETLVVPQSRSIPLVLAVTAMCLILSMAAAYLTTPSAAGREAFSLPADLSLSSYLKSYIAQAEAETTENSSRDTIPLALTEQFAWQTYRVRSGDTLLGIAKSFNLSIDAIVALNNITSARSLRSGMILKIPNMDGIPYTVKKGDSLSKISKTWGIPLEAILDANDLSSDVISPGTKLFLPGARLSALEIKRVLGNLFVFPVSGSISSPYGWRNDPFTGVRRFHAAIDIAQNPGVPVGAAMEGRVSATGFNPVYGNYVIINHDGGYQTMYAHLDTIRVKKGDRIQQKQAIGTVGNTGYSTGPHLHFALFKNGRAMNPLEVLGK